MVASVDHPNHDAVLCSCLVGSLGVKQSGKIQRRPTFHGSVLNMGSKWIKYTVCYIAAATAVLTTRKSTETAPWPLISELGGGSASKLPLIISWSHL